MDDVNEFQTRLTGIESELHRVTARIDRLEQRIAELAANAVDQKSLKRFVEVKTGRSGEMTSRIAQRLAKCEAAIELLARSEDPEAAEH